MSIRAQINLFALFMVSLLALAFLHSPQTQESEPLGPLAPADVRSYHQAVADYFQVPVGDLAGAAETVEALELPVVLFIARYGLSDTDAILELRQAGGSWQQVAAAHGLGPEAFYYPLPIRAGRPQGGAYEKYHRLPRAQWPTLELSDHEIVTLANLRFLAEHSGEGPARVAELSSQGHGFVGIHALLEQPGSQRAQAPAAGSGEEAS